MPGMDEQTLRELLASVRAGETNVDEAVGQLRRLPFESLGFATIDHHRAIRCGAPEVIYCGGKTSQQVREIFGKAVGRRGEVSQDTVAAWKRAKSQVAHRRGEKKKKKAAPVRDRAARFEAGEEDARVAIDVGEESPRDLREKTGKVKRAEPQPEKPGDGDAGDYTSRLLAAKRRARGESEGEDEQ